MSAYVAPDRQVTQWHILAVVCEGESGSIRSMSAIHYWGDIDTHGFAILDQLRNHFEHVSSFLMDRETLNAHEPQWGEEHDQVLHDLPRLTTEERALFDDLRDNRIRTNLRLEQERVAFQWVTDALARVSDLSTR